MDKQIIDKEVGSVVTVCYLDGDPGNIHRAGFGRQISVRGELEKHPRNGSYRVLVDEGTFVYFRDEDVIARAQAQGAACFFLKA